MRNYENGILHCKVLCINTDKKKIGIEENMWLPLSIELSHVYAIKANAETDVTGCTLYLKRDSFIVDIEYDEMLNYFMQSRIEKAEIKI